MASEPGLRWALAQLEAASGGRLRIERPRGTLASGVFAERITFQGPAFSVEALRPGARLRPGAALAGRLEFEPLAIDRLAISLSQGDEKPAKPPAIAFALRIARADIGRLEISRGALRYALREVRIAHFELGRLRTVSASASFASADARFPGSARLELKGSLERLQAAVELELLGASGQASAVLTPFDANRMQSLDAAASGIDLARFDRAWPRTAITAALKASAAGGGLAGILGLGNSAPGPVDEGRLPLASAATRFSTVGLESASFQEVRIVIAGGGLLEGAGYVGPGRIDATLDADGLNLRALRSNLRRTQLSGPLHLSLSPAGQSLRAMLTQEGITLSLEADRQGDVIEIGALHAQAEGGSASGSGEVRLGEPAAFSAELMLDKFNPAGFGDYPQGSISGAVVLDGRLGDAPQVDAGWSVADSTLFGRSLESEGRARFAPRELTDAEGEIKLGDITILAQGSFGRSGQELAFTVEAPRLEELVPQLAGKMKASGTLTGTWETPEARIAAQAEVAELPFGVRASTINAEFAGTLARHELRVFARAPEAELRARLRGALGSDQVWRGEVASLTSTGPAHIELVSPAPLRISRSRVELGRLEATLEEGRLLVREFQWSPERVSSSGEFTGLPAQSLVIVAGITERVRSTLLLDGQWTIAASPALEGTLRVRRSSGDVTLLEERPVELGLQAASLDARFTSAGVAAKMDLVSRFANAALGGQLGRAPQAGALGIGPGSPLLLQGRVELASLRLIAQPYLPDGRIDGRVAADVEASGTLGAPVLSGTLHGDALTFDLPPYGVYLKNGQLRARIAGDILQVEQFSIQAGQGRFTAKGSLPLRFADGNSKLTWQAREFTVLERPDMRLIASGDGEAGFDGKKLSLSGELRADRGSLEFEGERLPKLGDDVVITGEKRPTAKHKGPLPVALNVDLDLGSELSILWRGLEGKLAGRINVSTTKEGELRAYGRLYMVNATYFAYGQRLQVDPGVLIFDGPLENPALQITAWRRNQAVEAGVQLTGTVRAPRVQLVSQPPVPEAERLSWLVLGRAPTDTTKADLGLLQAAAGALLARGDQLPLDRRVAKSFGLDEVSFRGSGEVQDRVLAFGKRLSDRLYVSYEQGLGTVASNLVKLDYSLSRRWSLRAETGTSSGWGLFYRFSWD